MQQYTEPATAKVADDDNLTAAPWGNADAHGGDVAYRRLVGDDWQDVTFAAFRDEVAAVAKGFLAAGLQPGDRVGLISQTRYEWTLTDLALLTYAIEGSIDDRDFFARKAIGWALREYSKTDAGWVRGYVAAQASRLSPLSRREALKWLERRPGS